MNCINKDVVEQLLKRKNRRSGEIMVLNYEIKKNVVDEGSNYLSEVSQLIVTCAENGETCEKLFFLKIPSNIASYEMIAKAGLYRKEVHMYESVLPRFLTLLPEERFAPEHYYTGVKEILILEDLRQSGYEMRSKHEQLDFEHTAVVLRQLAKFHAVSVKVDQMTPEILDAARKDPFSEESAIMEEHRTLFEQKAEIVLNRAKLYIKNESSDNTLFRFRKQILPRTVEEVKMKPDSFNVLNHGDLWTNNVMFKYDAYGTIENVKFVDLQICRWTSPAVDILYFITNSVRFEIFEKYFDLLLNIYVDTLNKTLTYLKCDCVYKIEDLYRDIESKYNFWIHTMVFFTPMMVTRPEKGYVGLFDLGPLEDEYYVQLSKKWILYFIRKGAIPSKLDDTLTQSTHSIESNEKSLPNITKKVQ